MIPAPRIATVGFAPSWDMTCWVENLEWDECPRMTQQTLLPAGKALNVSKALCWFGIPSIASGFWGKGDFKQASAAIQQNWPLIDHRFVLCDGTTRINVTIHETATGRQLHLRGINTLPTQQALTLLQQQLNELERNIPVAFCGAFPSDKLLEQAIQLIKMIQRRGHPVIIDTSGEALKKAAQLDGLYLIKPNLEELSQIIGKSIDNTPPAIVSAAQSLCAKSRYVLVSRGKEGAILLTQEDVLSANTLETRPAITTVACGDFLLAGFLSVPYGPLIERLTAAIQAAAARAWGLDQTETWQTARQKIKVQIRSIF